MYKTVRPPDLQPRVGPHRRGGDNLVGISRPGVDHSGVAPPAAQRGRRGDVVAAAVRPIAVVPSQPGGTRHAELIATTSAGSAAITAWASRSATPPCGDGTSARTRSDIAVGHTGSLCPDRPSTSTGTSAAVCGLVHAERLGGRRRHPTIVNHAHHHATRADSELILGAHPPLTHDCARIERHPERRLGRRPVTIPSVNSDDPKPLTPPTTPEDVPRFSLRERIALTYRYHGPCSIVYRLLTYVLRFTPLRHRVRRGLIARRDRTSINWYRRNGRPVTIVIPSYRDAGEVAKLVASLRRTTDARLARIVVADDASGPDHLSALGAIPDISVVAGQTNVGFATNVNRGIAAADPRHDVVVLDSDTVARPGWLESLQYATRALTTSASSARSWSTATAGSSSPARCAISGPGNGSTTATASGPAALARRTSLSPRWP